MSTFRWTMRAVVVCIIVSLTIWTYLTQGPKDVSFVPPADMPAASVPHGCWTGNAPKDVSIPGHVWAVIPGGKSGVFGPYWTGKALDQQFGKESTFGLTVLGFCR